MLISLILRRCAAQSLGKSEKYQVYRELRNCLDVIEPIDGKPVEEVVRLELFHAVTTFVSTLEVAILTH